MKKILLTVVSIWFLFLNSTAQTAKWFVGFPTGYVIGGPAASLKSLMSDQSYDQSAAFIFNEDYPRKSYIPPLMVMAGKQISKYGSLYILVGQSDASTVKGYNGIASFDVYFNILQATMGYQFTFPNSHFKLGVGPSLFAFHYNLANYIPTVSSSETKPGISLMARVPFGKEAKLFGVELFFSMNIAQSVQVNNFHENINYGDFYLTGGNLSMVSAMLGLNFVFRK
jgi:hypothetical protein